MFYQEYRENEQLETAVKKMQPNTAYYLDSPIEGNDIQVKGDNGSYMLVNGQQVIYNPLINAEFSDEKITVHPITNLLEGKIVSKVQVEFSEKNTNPLSKNAIFINADMIRGYKQTDNKDIKIKVATNKGTSTRAVGLNILRFLTTCFKLSFIQTVTPSICSATVIVSSYVWCIGRTDIRTSSSKKSTDKTAEHAQDTTFLSESITHLLVPVVPDVKSITLISPLDALLITSAFDGRS